MNHHIIIPSAMHMVAIMEQEVRIFCVISISSSSHVFIASILCSTFCDGSS